MGGGEGAGDRGLSCVFHSYLYKGSCVLFFLYTSTSEWHLRNSKAFPNIAITVGDSVIICISIMSQCITFYAKCMQFIS